MRQLVFQHARELRRHRGQSLDWDADAAVVERAHPSRGAGDVCEDLLSVEDHADGFRGSEIQLRFDGAEVVFERAQDVARQSRRGAAVVAQHEMR